MADNKTGLILNFREIPNMRKNWPLFLIAGILFILLGMLSIGYAGWATEFAVVFFGFLLGFAGILHIVTSFCSHKWIGFSLNLLLGLLYVIVGILCIFMPLQSAMGITLVIAVLLLVGGLFRLISAPLHRYEHWRWVLFNGVIAFLLGLVILGQWPASSFWVIGVFVGVDLILIGASWTYLAVVTKKYISR